MTNLTWLVTQLIDNGAELEADMIDWLNGRAKDG